MNDWYSLTIPSETDSINEVEKKIAQVLDKAGFCEDDAFAICLALDEALANAIKHGNGYDATKNVSVRFRVKGELATIVVEDEGDGFDYNHQPDPTEPARLELPTGRGLLLMHSYMDSVTFNEKGNVVTMVKGRR